MGFFDHKIDVSDIPDSVGSEPLPEGHYLMKATDLDDTTPSKSSGADMLTVTFSFVDAAHAGRRDLNDYFVVKNQIAYSKLKKWMRAVGIDPNPEITKEMIGNAMGRQFQAKLTQEEYNGNVYNKLGTYLATGSAAAPQPSASSGDTTQQATATPSSDNLKKVEWN